MSKARILLTTPDYLPQLGGLTTYTLNFEQCLKELGISYELLHWKSISEIKSFTPSSDFTYVINIHYLCGYYLRKNIPSKKHINIYHGSEIFFTSPNFLKRVVKKMLKKSMIKYMSSTQNNIFISSYTQSIAQSAGLPISYDRDFIFHNCIDTTLASMTSVELTDHLQFCSIVRDTPHKNVRGCIELCENIQEITGKQVTLHLPFDHYTSNKITVQAHSTLTDEQREQLYKSVHFNLLLSLDHSRQGFIEGFGLSCLEAGKYGTPSIVFNTGGLVDNIHDSINGSIISTSKSQEARLLAPYLKQERYKLLREDTFNHTVSSHGLDQYNRLLKRLLI